MIETKIVLELPNRIQTYWKQQMKQQNIMFETKIHSELLNRSKLTNEGVK
jgi:hypothetical protein